MKDWQRIRLARTDLTDYVIHFTKTRFGDSNWEGRPKGFTKADDVFWEILNDGFIRPTFAKVQSKTYGGVSVTVRGPDPAVCLTEQPLSAVLITRANAGGRYSGFGIAYHKYVLFSSGGRPVFYGSKAMLGTLLKTGEEGYEEGKEIYKDGLPPSQQYLFVRYKPTVGNWDEYPIDFTWEREWRIKCSPPGLPVAVSNYEGVFNKETPIGALIVEKDDQVEHVRTLLKQKAAEGHRWATLLRVIVSLETVATKLKEGDARYARIETLPEEETVAPS